MNILNISLDKKLFEDNSKALKRVLGYRDLFNRYDLVVMSGRGFKKNEFDKMIIYPTNSISKLFYIFNAFKLGKKIIKKYKSNIISTQDPFKTGVTGHLLAKRFKLKLHIQIHGDFYSSKHWRKESLFNIPMYYLGKYIIKRADAVRVVSERIKRSLIKIGVDQNKIIIVPIYTGIRNQELGIRNYDSKDKFIFLTVGRLVPVKNIEIQIKAIAELVNNNKDIELWIVGEGNEEKKLKAISKKLGLEKYIKFISWQDDLGKYYIKADVFLLTSNYEGWGMVVIEAANFGLPIIMTDVGCAREIIKDGESGIIIPVGDQQVLKQAMIKLIKDKNSRKKLSKNAQVAIKNLPSKEESLELYKKSISIN